MRDGNNPGALCIPNKRRKDEPMQERNWEEIYEAILKDIVYVIEGNRADYEKVEFITSILVGNDFMEKPPLYS